MTIFGHFPGFFCTFSRPEILSFCLSNHTSSGSIGFRPRSQSFILLRAIPPSTRKLFEIFRSKHLVPAHHFASAYLKFCVDSAFDSIMRRGSDCKSLVAPRIHRGYILLLDIILLQGNQRLDAYTTSIQVGFELNWLTRKKKISADISSSGSSLFTDNQGILVQAKTASDSCLSLHKSVHTNIRIK